MKAILINASDETVELIDVEKGLDGIYKAIGFNCNTIELVTYPGQNNVLFVDEEVLIRDTHGMDEKGYFGFFYDASVNAGRFDKVFNILGNGLILGIDDEGDSVDTTMNIDVVRRRVRFMPRYYAAKYRQNPPPPSIRMMDL